ncbi:hypothetical protein [Geomicrobium sp. JCM 19039]|uniref:hypothetical protein n=1 Tax=Geomicrobium sp. JCM 19039 TaxID=1460636 RepID=UPI00045F4BBB|nr:hypothetical protein [Geomicrobium sp. JCM 19039]GAK11096.1 hypothetical protein JCM19039_769 [Geomicrobium sp. JCM 19039]
MEGYNEYYEVGASDLPWWHQAVKHVFLDEVMWLMAEVEEDWARQEQVKRFESAVSIVQNIDQFRIDGRKEE